MELKGIKDWSEEDSDATENPKSSERPPAPAPVPERKPPVFDLGIIYKRPELPPAPEPIFQERERKEPEVAQGIAPGGMERETNEPPISLPPAAEAAYVQHELEANRLPHNETDEDDDEDAEEEKRDPPAAIREESVPPADVVDKLEDAPADLAPLVPVYAEPPRTEFSAPAESTIEANESPTPWHFAASHTQQPPTSVPSPRQAFGGNFTPPPPPPPEGPASAPGYPEPEPWRRWPEGGYAAQSNIPEHTAHASVNPNYANMVTRREFDRAQESNRRRMIAAVITSLAIGWYIGRRKVKPLQKQVESLEAQTAAQTARLADFERQQLASQDVIKRQDQELRQAANQMPVVPAAVERPQPAAASAFEMPFESSAASQPAFAPTPASARAPEATRFQQPLASAPEGAQPGGPAEVKVVGEDGQEIVLQPGERLVRAGEGQYAFVVDKYNRVVHDRIRYGESYKQDLMPERMPTPFGSKDARFVAGGGAAGGQAAAMGGGTGGGGDAGSIMTSSGMGTTLPSGQVPANYSLPADSAGHTSQDEAQHLLNAPKPNPVIAAITSPWLWLAVGVLMIAFFAAATI